MSKGKENDFTSLLKASAKAGDYKKKSERWLSIGREITIMALLSLDPASRIKVRRLCVVSNGSLHSMLESRMTSEGGIPF